MPQETRNLIVGRMYDIRLFPNDVPCFAVYIGWFDDGAYMFKPLSDRHPYDVVDGFIHFTHKPSIYVVNKYGIRKHFTNLHDYEKAN